MRVLERLAETRGLPKEIIMDNGPEMIGKVLDQWAWRNSVRLHFIDLGKPTQNAFIESFNGRFRDECLNQHWFLDLADAARPLRPGGSITTTAGPIRRSAMPRPRNSPQLTRGMPLVS